MPEQTISPGSGDAIRHPIFARVYERVAQMSERRGGAEHRQKLLADLSGRVIEVGAGASLSAPRRFYRPTPISSEWRAARESLALAHEPTDDGHLSAEAVCY